LNEYSRRFAGALLERFPFFVGHARTDKDDDGKEGVLVVEFAPDSARPGCLFVVSTHGSEVTVGLDEWHGHFDWPDEDVLTFIEDLVAGRSAVEVHLKEGRYAGSSVVARAGVPAVHPSLTEDESVYYRFWRAVDDREFHGEVAVSAHVVPSFTS
jgi:hypothetical protein